MKNTVIKLGDKVTTEQDHYKSYVGTIIEIKKMAHPYRSSDRELTWYRVEYGFRQGSFLTCDTSIFN